MSKEDIYDHLAQVYLGKRKVVDEKKKREFNAWLVINIFITVIIFSSAFYGLTAFLTQNGSSFQNNIIFSLHRGTIQFDYNFKNNMSDEQVFSLSIPKMEVSKYHNIQFSIRGKEEGTPGIVKVVFRNQMKEEAAYYIQGVGLDWRNFDIPLEDFKQITDWDSINEILFVVETWNVDKKKGIVLIENVSFSG